MNLYLISHSVNTGYDTYDAAVVAAETKKGARSIEPSQSATSLHEWAPAKKVKVELIGKATNGTKAGVILASFHAG